MSLLPNVERELMRVAYAPADGSSAGVRVGSRAVWRGRFSGAVLAAAVSVVALLIGAGFLIALRGAGTGGGSPAMHPSNPSPPVGRGAFPGAPRPSHGHFTKHGVYVCPRAPRNRYLPRVAGCVSVLRADMTGAGAQDLVLLYADLGGRHFRQGYEPVAYTLELVRPGGAIARTRLPTEGNQPLFVRAGNVNGRPGDELVLLLAYVSSGDVYGIATLHDGRLWLADAQLAAGGDSGAKEGFACRVRPRPEVISRTMILLGPTIHGRWRWTVETYAWHGSMLRRIAGRTFVRRGLPPRRLLTAGAGCGRPVGAPESKS
ncbi:MAG TPA: hypothetical protein VKV21_11245 [Solirubrobacteraceae bacterium]|nr:hypothetical protein [Solirubrobacteraceae bacterium]